MSTEDLTSANNEVIALIQKYQDISNKSLADTISKACKSKGIQIAVEDKVTKKDPDKKPYWPFFANLILIFTISFLVSINIPPLVTDPTLFDPKLLFMLLAFVVALSSYLASVTRETVKSMPPPLSQGRKEKKKNISMMVTAEIPLVVTGVLIIGRLFLANTEWFKTVVNSSSCYDNFLLTLLSVTILWMAGLHFRMWILNLPWMIDK